MTATSQPNPFEMLGLPATFDLDPKALDERERALARALHPDRYVGRPTGERRAALSRAIEVNDAARLLRDPLRRGEALLKMLGLDLSEGSEPAMDPEFLMETMDRREALRDAGRKKDSALIEELAARVEREQGALLEELRSDFSRAAAENATPGDALTTKIRQKLGKLRYLRRFLQEAFALLDEV